MPHLARANGFRTLAACAAVVGVFGASTAPVQATQGRSVCRVEFTMHSSMIYNPTLNLSGAVIMGRHNYAPASRSGGPTQTGFEVLDNDGFLTLYILVNEWKATGLLDRNMTQAATVPRSDIELALRAVRLGITYHRALMDRIEAEQPENYNDIHQLLTLKLGHLGNLEAQWAPLANGAGGTIELPRGFIRSHLAPLLDGLVPGPDQTMMAQYFDRPHGGAPNILCDTEAASSFVGQLLCGFRVADGTGRDPAICPDGMSFTRLSALPLCRRVGQEDQC